MSAHAEPKPARTAPIAGDAPVWLLDFDGVINAVTRIPDPDAWDRWESVLVPHEHMEYHVWYSPEVVKFVADAVAAGVRVLWLTDWRQWTYRFPTVIPGMPDLEWLGDPTPDSGRFRAWWWKTRAVDSFVPRGFPLVWTDDLLDGNKQPTAWASARNNAAYSPTLVVSPDPATGLTRADLNRISRWLKDTTGIVVPHPVAGAMSTD